MAEGGEEDPDNPFSFSKFVKKKKKNTQLFDQETENKDIDDMFDLPGDQGSRRKEKTLIVADEEETEESSVSTSSKKKKSAENPFSFKKFLANPGSTSGRSKNVAPDFATDLPDFVQDHFSGDGRGKTLHLSDNDLDLPDLSLSSSPRANSDDAFLTEAVSLDLSNTLDGSFNSDNENTSVLNRNTLPSRLPDFLPDGVMGSSGLLNDNYDNVSNSLYTSRNLSSVEVSGDTELEMRRLRKDNEDLRLQLEETKHLAQTESNRVSKLIKQLERQHQKEVDETNVMERAVMQVEENLVTTTKRAVMAETTVSKLKQEIKALQHQIASLQAENAALSSGDQGLADIRERTKYASEQLATAANSGEQQLKQLKSGIDNLRLLSQVLASIDKVKDYTPPTSEPTGDT